MFRKAILLLAVADMALISPVSALAADIPTESMQISEQEEQSFNEVFPIEIADSTEQSQVLPTDEQSEPILEQIPPQTLIPPAEITETPEPVNPVPTENISPPAEEPEQDDFVIENNVLLKYSGTDAIVTIPEGVVRIKYHAFYDNDTVNQIIFPRSLSRIDDVIIEDCPNLSDITANNRHMGITSGSKCIFGTSDIEVTGYYNSSLREYCDKYNNLSFTVINPLPSNNDFEITDGKLTDYLGNSEEVIIPEGVTSIANQVFKDNLSLKKVTVPDSFKHLQWQTFSGCINLQEVTVKGRDITIVDGTFEDCEKAEIIGYRFSALSDYCNERDNLTFRAIDPEPLVTVNEQDAQPEIFHNGTEQQELYKVTVYDMVHTYAKDGLYNPDGRAIYIKDIGYSDELLAKIGGILRFQVNQSLIKRGLLTASPDSIETTVNGKDIEITFHYWDKGYSDRNIGTDATSKGTEAFASTNLYMDMNSFTRGKDLLDGINITYSGNKKYYKYTYDTDGYLEGKVKTSSDSLGGVTNGGYTKLLSDTVESGGKASQTVPYQELYKIVPILDSNGKTYEDNYGNTNLYTIGYQYTGTGSTDSIKIMDTIGASVGTVTLEYSGANGYHSEPIPNVSYSISDLADGWNLEVNTGRKDNFLSTSEQGAYIGIEATAPAVTITEDMVSNPIDTVYDNKEHKFVPVITQGVDILKSGKDYTVSYDTEDFKNAGTVNMIVEGINNYTGAVTKTYVIGKREASVYDEISIGYTGVPQTLSISGKKAENLITGHKLELTDAAISGTDANEYTNISKYIWQITDSKGKDVSSNYKVDVTGKLVIGKRSVSVYEEGSMGYEGILQTVSISGADAVGLVKGHKLYLKDALISGMEVGSYTEVGGYTWQITDAIGKDVSNNYAISVAGKLVIGKRKASVHKDVTWGYTGSAQILPISGESAENLTYGHKLELKDAAITGQDTGIHTKVSKYTWQITDSTGKDVSANYDISVAGKLVIGKQTVAVYAEATHEYTGKDISFNITSDTAVNLIRGHKLELEDATITGQGIGTYTDVGKYKWKITDTLGKDVSTNYELQVAGKLVITPPKEEEKPDLPEETPDIPEEKPIPPEEKPARPEEKPDLPEDNKPVPPEVGDNGNTSAPPDNSKPVVPDTGGNAPTPPSEEPLKPTVENNNGIDSTLLSEGSREATQILANTGDNITAPKTGDNGYLAEIWSLIISIVVMAIGIIKRRR